jgi:exopolysaccharide biosynthesis polyprenyl glycosylphosphotransferase
MDENRWSSRFATIAFATDLVLINGSFLVTSLMKFGTLYPTDDFALIYFNFQIFVNLVFPLCLVMAGAYRDIARAPLGHQAVTSFKACVWAGAVTIAALFLVRNTGYSRAYVSFHLAQVAVLIPFSRILLERVNAAARLRGVGARPVLLVGERAPLQDLALRLRMAPYLGYQIEAIYPIGFDAPQENGHGPRIVTDRAELRTLLLSGRIGRIFIAAAEVRRSRWKEVVDLAEELGVETRLVRWPLLVPSERAQIHEPLTVPLVPAAVVPRCHGAGALLKRAVDIAVSSALLLVLSPFLTAVALAIKLDTPGPVFYGQERLTRGSRRFRILKFRSMHTLADEERARLGGDNQATGPLFKMKNDPRVTRVGGWLRRFSLDELPQLFNVLAGNLTLVGPRPPLPEEVEKYEPWQRQRLDVVQGMTGLWQVSGRSRLSFEEMVLLDLYYIERWSPLLDIEILMETVPTILHGDGAY